MWFWLLSEVDLPLYFNDSDMYYWIMLTGPDEASLMQFNDVNMLSVSFLSSLSIKKNTSNLQTSNFLVALDTVPSITVLVRS